MDAGVRKAGWEEDTNERAFCASVILLTCFPFFPATLLGQKEAGQWTEEHNVHVAGTVSEGSREMEDSLGITTVLPGRWVIKSPASVSFSTVQMYMPNPCSQSPAVKTSTAFAGKKVTVKQVSRLNIYGLESQVLPTVSNFGHAVWGWDGPKQQAAGGLGRGTPGNTAGSLCSLLDHECHLCLPPI